jgi:ribosomal protein L37AE/L43A
MICGRCGQPATKRLKSGLLRCADCYASLNIPVELQVPDLEPPKTVEPTLQPVVRAGFLGNLVRDWKLRGSGTEAA